MGPYPEPGNQGFQWQRSLSALLRYKWIVLVLTLAGLALGVAGSKFIAPEYQAHATIWISTESGQGSRTGPIRAEELLTASSWPGLLRSFEILEKVARARSLFLSPAVPADSQVFTGFKIEDRVRPGAYELRVTGQSRYVLATANREIVDSGAVGDSIGRKLGFLWAPSAEVLTAGRVVQFSVATPRAAAVSLSSRLSIPAVQEHSNLLQVSLRGSDPVATAATLNTLIDEFIITAAELKKRNLAEMARALSEQLDYAYLELKAAEIQLENFRVTTITKPSEGTAVAGGVELTRDPVFASFFQQRIDLDNAKRDREALERALALVQRGDGSYNAFWAIPAVQAYGQELRNALTEYASREAAVRTLLARYTEHNPDVEDAQRAVQTLRTVTIPPLVNALIAQLRAREVDLDSRLASASRELREIPARTIEELRLRRNVSTRDNLYTMLKNRFEEARLADASSVPDVSVLDRAAPPTAPSRNTAPQLILIALVGSLGGSVVLALLLDRLDRRFRYPEQATQELGLSILGAVPALRNTASSRHGVEEQSQAVEAFRAIRLTLINLLRGSRPLQVAISSPGIGDGKSIVSANLALSFAEGGYSTLLIDGDIRRGELHAVFDVPRRPGFIDAIAGAISVEDGLRPTSHPRLTLMPTGTRSRHGPELLMSPALPTLLATLGARFQVIIIDTPPLGAGIDPFALGSATGNMLLVLRSGETDRKMAEAKLELLDRLPVRMLGAVLNDISAKGVYRYYSYLNEYASTEELEPEVTGGPRPELVHPR
jgi:capsular exopolysaccharide synthesis family protein